MEIFSRSDIDRIMAFVVSRFNKTQKIIIEEISDEFTSATAFVNHIAEKHSISKTAIWYNFRILCEYMIISKEPKITAFGEKIKGVVMQGYPSGRRG